MDWATASSIRPVSAPGSYCSRIQSLPETVLATIRQVWTDSIFFVRRRRFMRRKFSGDKRCRKKYNLTSLRLCNIFSGGTAERNLLSVERKFGLEILDGIGSTELMHILSPTVPEMLSREARLKSCRDTLLNVDDDGVEYPTVKSVIFKSKANRWLLSTPPAR